MNEVHWRHRVEVWYTTTPPPPPHTHPSADCPFKGGYGRQLRTQAERVDGAQHLTSNLHQRLIDHLVPLFPLKVWFHEATSHLCLVAGNEDVTVQGSPERHWYGKPHLCHPRTGQSCLCLYAGSRFILNTNSLTNCWFAAAISPLSLPSVFCSTVPLTRRHERIKLPLCCYCSGHLWIAGWRSVLLWYRNATPVALRAA